MISQLVAGIALFYLFKPLITTIAWAAIGAIALYPVYSKLRRRWFALFLVILLLAAITYVAYFSSIFLYGQIMKLVNFFNQLSPQYRAPLLQVSRNIPVEDFARQIISAVPGAIVRIPLFVIFLYYLLVDGHRLRNFAIRVLGRKGEKIADRVWKNASSVVNGIFVNATVFAAFGTIVLYYAGAKNPLLYAVAAAFISILPLIGAWMFYAYVAFELYMAGNYTGIALIAAFLLLWSIFGDTYFKLRYRGDLHPAVLIASIFAGMFYFGFTGILIGPVAVTVLEELLIERG